jgi:anti-anti-sigma regulatory factor
VYGAGGPVDAEQVVAGYAAATERALADGYRGLRASADATELLRTPHHRDALARYEFLVDRYMASHPLSALCGFATELGTETVTEFAAMHDPGPSGEPAFRVFGCPDGALGLGGQFDPVTVGALGRVLDRLRAGADAGVLVIDMADVEYVDHRLLLTLSDHARATGVALSVRSAPPFAARLVDLLPASSLRLSQVGAES